jgi:hypothetical protein
MAAAWNGFWQVVVVVTISNIQARVQLSSVGRRMEGHAGAAFGLTSM